MLELNYKSFGQGTPIIILHGLFGTLDNWQTMARQLAANFTVYILDQRNHGRSPHRDEISYPIMAEDLRDFMESNWIYKSHIIGHSMGGKTAMQFALEYPDMVDKLVVVDIAPKAYRGGHEAIFEALLEIDLLAIENRKQAGDLLAVKIQDLAVRQFLLKNLTRSKSGNYKWKMNLEALHRQYQDLLAGIDLDAHFSGPTLFLRGAQSAYISKDDEPAIQEKFPQAGIVSIEGAGHWVHAEAPKPFFDALQSFLM